MKLSRADSSASRYLHEHLGEDVLLVVPATQVLKQGRGVGDEESPLRRPYASHLA